jgi:hypothetical protein
LKAIGILAATEEMICHLKDAGILAAEA